MHTKILAILLILGVALAADCQQLADEDKLPAEGDCYREAEEWGECIYYYLTAARESELKWDLNKGPAGSNAIALKYYNPMYYDFSGLGSDMGKCVYNYNKAGLKDQLQAYYTWMSYYVSKPSAPPFEMDALISEIKSEVFVAPPVEPTIPQPAVAELCAMANTEGVYLCKEGTLKWTTTLLGGGSTYYAADGKSFQCPIVGLDSMADECKAIMMDSAYCSEASLCAKKEVPPAPPVDNTPPVETNDNGILIMGLLTAVGIILLAIVAIAAFFLLKGKKKPKHEAHKKEEPKHEHKPHHAPAPKPKFTTVGQSTKKAKKK